MESTVIIYVVGCNVYHSQWIHRPGLWKRERKNKIIRVNKFILQNKKKKLGILSSISSWSMAIDLKGKKRGLFIRTEIKYSEEFIFIISIIWEIHKVFNLHFAFTHSLNAIHFKLVFQIILINYRWREAN
jgi:hypothetical protein